MKKTIVILLLTISILSIFAFSTDALARGGGGGGGHSLQFAAGLSTASQDDINSWVSALNTAGTQQLGSGYEFSATYHYRFSSSIFEIMFRPSYFMQNAEGGSVKESLSAITFYPGLRLYPLENNFIRFFMQVGIGYGSLSGTLSNGSASASFSGWSFGMLGGLGADFCFTDSHCLTIEGNFRYHPIPRSTVSSSSGTLGGSMTQHAANQELEFRGSDVQNTLSGIQGILAYTLRF